MTGTRGTQEPLASRLAAVTGNLREGPRTPRGTLAEARRIVAAALAAGTPIEDVVPPWLTAHVAAPADGAVQALADAVATGAAPAAPVAVRLTAHPAGLGFADRRFPSQQSQRMGPLFTPDGLELDLIIVWGAVATSVVQAGRTVAVLPMPRLRRTRPTRRFALAAGSAWIEARALTGAPAAAGAFAGLRIGGGQLVVEGPVTFSGGNLVIPANTPFTVHLNLAPPPAPSPTSAVGADGSSATVSYPPSVSFALGVATPEASGFTALEATVWGEPTTLTLAGGAPVTLVWDAADEAVRIPLSPAPGTLLIGASAGTDVRFTASAGGGNLAVVRAGWSLPATRANPSALGLAVGDGSVVVEVGPGLAVNGYGQVLQLSAATVTVGPGSLSVAGTCVDGGGLRYPVGAAGDDGFVAFRLPPGAPVQAAVTDGTEALFAKGECTAALVVPVDVTGARVPTTSVDATLAWVRTDADHRFLAIGATSGRPTSYALDNAVIPTSGPRGLVVAGRLFGDGMGNVIALFPVRLLGLTLALPDPYATSQPPSGGGKEGPTAIVGVHAAPGGKPIVALRLGGAAGWTPVVSPAAPAHRRRSRSAENTMVQRRGWGLLDVSGAADIFGVELEGRPELQLQGIAVTGDLRGMALLAPPAVSWEPVERFDQFGNDLGRSVAPNDGPPTRLRVPGPGHVPVAPADLIAAQTSAVQAGRGVFAEFSLPFGLVADVGSGTGGGAAVQLKLVRPTFDVEGTQPGGLPVTHTGGFQLRMEPRGIVSENTGLDGQMNFANPYAPQLFPVEVNTWLGGGNSPVPVQRIDLSGWGESGFSHWVDPSDTKVGLVEARFEVVVGRATREVLTFASFVWPWAIRVKRTFTFERQADGGIIETDSGWVAIDDGMFASARLGSLRPNCGPFQGVVRPTRILDTPTFHGDPTAFQGRVVTFNGDLLMSPDLVVRAGATRLPGVSGTFVPATGLLGLLQVTPYNTSPPPGSTMTLPPNGLASVLHDNPLGATPLHCIVDLGSPGQPGLTLRVTAVEVAMSRNQAKVVTALRGAPVLPKSGAWTVGHRDPNAAAPGAVGAGAPVPLVRARTSDPWALAEPADALNTAAATASPYSFIQGSATQKALFELPTIPVAGTAAAGTVNFATSQLAHAGVLLGAAGPFGSLLDGIGIHSALSNLDVVAGAIATPSSIAQPFTVTHSPAHLADFGPVHATFELGETGNSTDATLQFDSPGDWQMKLEKVRVCLSVDGLGADPLITVLGTIQASSSTAPSLSDIDVRYGGFLNPLTQVFSNLQQLASFLPGSSPPGLDVSFAGGTLTVRDQFALPTLPLGFGQISDISLDLGATVAVMPPSLEFLAGIASPETPFHWILSPLSGTGCVEVGVRNGDLLLLVQAGLGLGLSIDVGIASGSASITLALQVDNLTAAIEIKIILTGQASVDVLGGLASASLTLSAGLSIAVQTTPRELTVGGDVGVGIHISICWVIDIDFDGSWHFEESFSA